MIGNKELFSEVFNYSPWRCVVAILLLIAAALSEIFGLASIVPLFSVLLSSTQSVSGAGSIVSWFGVSPSTGMFGPLALSVIFGITLRGIFLFCAHILVGILAAGLERKFADKMTAALTCARWDFWLSTGISSSVTGVTRLTREFNSMITLLPSALTGLTLSSIFLCAAGALSRGALLAAVAIGLPILISMRIVTAKTRRAALDQHNTLEQRHAQVMESFHSIKFIKAHCGERSLIESISIHNRSVEARGLDLSKYAALAVTLPDTLVVIGVCSILFALNSFAPNRSESVVIALLLIYRALHYLNQFQSSRNLINQFLPSFHAMKALCQSAKENYEIAYPIALAEPLLTFNQSIEFKNITFFYGNGFKVFSDYNLKIERGAKIHIDGPSGAGKTTLIDLLLGIHTPTSGVISIDGVPLCAGNIRNWRSLVTYVPQEAPIFQGTVRDNLLWGDVHASEAELWQALRQVRLEEVIAQRTEGLNAIVGERGISLSGGQRQRLAVARALLRQSPLLILDEATNALDEENARVVWEIISEIAASKTVVIVAHQRVAGVNNLKTIYLESNLDRSPNTA